MWPFPFIEVLFSPTSLIAGVIVVIGFLVIRKIVLNARERKRNATPEQKRLEWLLNIGLLIAIGIMFIINPTRALELLTGEDIPDETSKTSVTEYLQSPRADTSEWETFESVSYDYSFKVPPKAEVRGPTTTKLGSGGKSTTLDPKLSQDVIISSWPHNIRLTVNAYKGTHKNLDDVVNYWQNNREEFEPVIVTSDGDIPKEPDLNYDVVARTKLGKNNVIVISNDYIYTKQGELRLTVYVELDGVHYLVIDEDIDRGSEKLTAKFIFDIVSTIEAHNAPSTLDF